MRKFFLFFTFLILFFLNNSVYSYINSNIQVKGITNLSIDTTKGNGGNIVFPTSNSGVFIDASNLESNANSDINISGNFWIQNLSSDINKNYGWVTFDIGLVTGAPKVVLKNQGDNTFLFEGYAWSKSAGWIYFGDTGIVNGKIIYDRTNQKIDGCAWSQNIGWICIDNFDLDTTPPDLSNINSYFSANHLKNLTFTDNDIDKIEITNWDSSAVTTYNSLLIPDIKNITHDFRKAKDYTIKVTDNSGNSTTKNVQVVAGEPSITSSTSNIGTGSSIFSPDTITLKDANGIAKYEIKFSIRDTYGNPIIKETGIKDVEVEIGFDNNVHNDQINNFGYDKGKAILYSGSNFYSIFNTLTGYDTGTGYTSDGNYSIYISSIAPTKEGYKYTSDNNDIKISKLIIKVTDLSGLTGVGEGNFEIFEDNINKNFMFGPSVYINNINNSNNWNIISGIQTTFTGDIIIDNPNDVKDIKITHLLDTIIPPIDHKFDPIIRSNEYISFQNLETNSGATNFAGYGYNTDTNYECSFSGCDYIDYPYSSNLIFNYDGPYVISTSFTNTIKTTPRLVTPWLFQYISKYNSLIEYKTNSIDIKYPSFYYQSNSGVVINNQIKITGLATNNSYSLIEGDSTIRIGDISKSLVFKNIKANIVPYQQIGRGIGNVMYMTGAYTLSTWPAGIDTIIVDGGDLIIANDISKTGNQIKSLVALKKEDGTSGNIWIKDNVSRIEAILVTDRSILSGDGTFYPDNSAQNQLFIKGSIISYNTIGGSSLGIPECPFYIQSCDFDTAKKYDLNNFRYYIKDIQGTEVTSLPSNDGYDEAAMIVEYDSLLQTNTPKIFLLDN